MGTQGPGRKRIPNREKVTAEDDALNQIAREAEARLAAKRAARAEAREIRMKELERQQKEVHTASSDWSREGSPDWLLILTNVQSQPLIVEERPDRDFLDKGSRTASTLSAATLASLGGASSRRGSCDTSFSVETEASIRDMKESLVEAEEKYRRAMVSNAQLHNEKSALMYQVETLKEELSNMEELLWESRRHCDGRTKEFERERQAHSVLQFQFKEMKETLTQTEELLTEVSDLRVKSSSYCQEVSDLQEVLQWKEKKMSALFSRELFKLLRIMSSYFCVAELRLKKLLEERESLHDQVRLLKSQLDQRQKNGNDGVQNPEGGGLENGIDAHLLDLQRDANRQMSELKFKLVKSEQEVTTLEQNVIRLEGQVTRYKSASENAEKVEDELKVEKRKLQRELRSALDRIDELEASNSHLSKRLEKMKANRNALLAQQ
uniref:Leucine-rich repeat flightless-interacting protein 2 n=1 Tax=Dicentrarchus labrax TaxID=13489 RepID=A0A8P4KK19_DICLA